MPEHSHWKPMTVSVALAVACGLFAPATLAADTSDSMARNVLDTLTVEAQSDDYDSNTDRPTGWAASSSLGGSANTRDDILTRDLTDVTYSANNRVATGVLDDPYTGETISFVSTAAGGNSNTVQIDHVVAYGEAWESGLDEADEQTRIDYYNDPYVLLAVKGAANSSKSDKDAAEWLPSTYTSGYDDYDCWYAARQIGVKDKYSLSVDGDEKAALEDVLASCPTITIPTDGGAYWTYTTADTSTGSDDDATYSTDDLKNVVVTVNGEAVEFDPETGFAGELDGLPTVESGIPDGWDVMMTAMVGPQWSDEDTGCAYTDNSSRGTITFIAPDGTEFSYGFSVPGETIVYNCDTNAGEDADSDTDNTDTDSAYSTADLAGMTIIVNGYDIGFDPEVTGYRIPADVFESLFDAVEDSADPQSLLDVSNLPEGWTANLEIGVVSGTDLDGNETGTRRDVIITFTAPDGTEFVYRLDAVESDEDDDDDVAAGTVTDTGSDPDDTDVDTAADADDDTDSDTGTATESDGDDTVLARTGVSTPLPLLIPIILMMAFGVTPVRRRHHV